MSNPLFKMSLISLLLALSCVNAFESTKLGNPLSRTYGAVVSSLENGRWSDFGTTSTFSKAYLDASKRLQWHPLVTSSTVHSPQIQPLWSLEITSAETASRPITSTATQKLKSISQSLHGWQWSDGAEKLVRFGKAHWWSIPLFLALVPLFTTFVLGTGDPSMPHWWPVTKMDHIVSAPNAVMVVGFFLFSNIAYFAVGAFLVARFPFVKPTIRNNNVGTGSSLILSKMQERIRVPTRQTWLGLLMLGSGLISTLFHAEQALGSYALANSLCYLDHAVAGTATFYFFHICAKPSKLVLTLGLAGLAFLSIPLPGYAWLHSAWHFLSAAAAVIWAVESFEDKPQTAMVEAIALPNSGSPNAFGQD